MNYQLVLAVLSVTWILLAAGLAAAIVHIIRYERKAKRDLKIDVQPIVKGLCWVFRDALEKGKDWNLALGAWVLHSEAWVRLYPKDEEAITEAVRVFGTALKLRVNEVQREECCCSRADACTKTGEKILAETWSPVEEAEKPDRVKVNLTPLDNGWNSLALFATRHRR